MAASTKCFYNLAYVNIFLITTDRNTGSIIDNKQINFWISFPHVIEDVENVFRLFNICNAIFFYLRSIIRNIPKTKAYIGRYTPYMFGSFLFFQLQEASYQNHSIHYYDNLQFCSAYF